MNGTVVCAVTDGVENEGAVAQAAELSERLGLRLVLAHVVDGIAPGNGDGDESVTARGDRLAAERRLMELARKHRVEASAERRIEVGDPARLLGQIASEEAADVIVVGVPEKRWGRRRLESKLAEGLEGDSTVPVLIAPSRLRGHAKREARPSREYV